MLAFIRNQLERNRRYRQTFDELSQCTDMELRDLGISRGDIHAIAKLAMNPGELTSAPDGAFDLTALHDERRAA